MEKITKGKKYLKYISGIGIFAILGYVLALIFLPSQSLFFWGIIKAVAVISMFALFDKYVLININTLDEVVENKNIAYGLFLLAIAIIFASAIVSL